MLRRIIARFPWLPDVLTAVVLLAGAVWRYLHIFHFHDPRKFIYSDMEMYVQLGVRISHPNHVLLPSELTHPPGYPYLLAWAYKSGVEFGPVLWIQFAIAVALPLAVGGLAWLTFGKSSARWAAAVTTVYFPFVDYAAFFLTEVYLALFATLTLVCYFGALKLAERVPRGPKRLVALVGLGLLGGIFFSLAAVVKMVAMPAISGFVLLHFLFTHGVPRRTRGIVIAAALLGATPLMGWQAARCTQANEGRFCSGSAKAPGDFLLGHYGAIHGITWKDPKHGAVGFSSPSSSQHCYQGMPEVPFFMTDSEKNYALAWEWIGKHPWHATVLSFEHVWDTLGGTVAWPGVTTRYWATTQMYNYLFHAFLLFPTLALLVDIARARGLLGLLRSLELAVFAPIFGVLLSVFLATGEARYRIPWDASFIVLAVEFFRRLRVPLREKPAAPLVDLNRAY